MHTNTLHTANTGPSVGSEDSEEPRQQLAPGLEPEGSSTSDPSQFLRLDPNSWSEANQMSTRADDTSRAKSSTGDLTSTFFAAATGTTVNGPAHFASTNTTSNQLIVHINPNFIHAGSELPNPIVVTFTSPRPSELPLPVNPVNDIPSNPSNVGTPYSTESTVADVHPPKDNEIYERLLRRKRRGFALYIPQPNRRLPIAYQRIGIHIGDVGIITPDGGFSFLFNICVPRDDPINPRILPEDFCPLQPALTDADVVEFSRFNSGSYLASESIEKKESKSNAKGLHFETSASEGAVLTMPEGAISLDLENDAVFSDYLEANVWKWYEFVSRVRGRRKILNGQIRLVVGCDKTTAWGIATVSGMSQQSTTKLKFKPLETTSSSTTIYTWECSGIVEERVGPDRHEIDALRNGDSGRPELDTTLRNQCLFVRTMTATLSNDQWAKLSRNLGKTTVKDSYTSSGTASDSSPANMPTGSNSKSSSQPTPTSQQGPIGPQSYATGQSGIMISKMPDSSAPPYHPSDDLNQQLLQKFPRCKMAITNDYAWLSTFNGEMTSIGRVLASHNVRIENGVLRLDRKYEMRGYNSSSFLSNSLWVAMSNGASEDVDDPQVDIRNPSSNKQTNTKRELETEQEKRKHSVQQTRQAGSQFMHREKARLSSVKEHLSPTQENESLTAPSRDKISKLHIGVFSI